MSVNSIDTQIMVARTADYSRDTSAIQRKPEISQEQLAFREKINDAQDQSRIAKMSESKLSELRDEESGGGAGYEGRRNPHSGGKEKGDTSGEDMFVPSAEHKIDITV